MALRPYEEVVGPLVIPYRGKEYELPPVSMKDGLRIHKSLSNEETVMWSDLIPMLLGEDVYEAMLADHVPPAVIDRALWTALAEFKNGRESAEAVWENGVPKGLLESLVTILQKQEQTTPTGAASTTPQLASTSGTKSPRKPKATRSRGVKSSTTEA